MDGETKSLLDRLALPNLSTTALSELEAFDEELAGVKSTRSEVEYYWTTTPALCLLMLADEPSIEMITYLDADMRFFADPTPLFDEFDGASIMIVPHRWSDRLSSMEEDFGTYNVGWLTFRRDANGLAALRWWRQRCLEWCYDLPEDNKFGDQRYLDEFPARFERVHVLQHLGGGVGPWNSEQHQFDRRDGRLLIDGIPVIFYHYSSFRLIDGGNILHRLGIDRALYTGRLRHVPNDARLTWAAMYYKLSPREQALHWDDYAAAVAEAILELRRIAPDFKGEIESLSVGAHARYVRDYVVERMMPLAREWRERLQTSTPSWLLPGPVKRFREHLREIRRMVGETQDELIQIHGALADIGLQLQELTGEEDAATTGPSSLPEWEFVPEGWARAGAVRGWSAAEVARSYREKWPRFLEAVDGTGPLGADHQVRIGEPIEREDSTAQNGVLAWAYALARAASGGHTLSVLDWGGALGHYYVFARRLMPDVEFDYHCRELPEVCAEGRRVLPEVTFHEDEGCLEQTYDLVLASNSLHYEEDWRVRFRGLAEAASGWLFLTQVPLVREHGSFVVLQRAHEYGYATEYLGWALSRGEVLDAASSYGLTLVREFAIQPPFVIDGAPEPMAHGGFLFRRSTDAT